MESLCIFNGKRVGAFISNFNIVLSQEVAFYCILCLSMTALLQMKWLLPFQQQLKFLEQITITSNGTEGDKFIAYLNFFLWMKH